MLELLAEYAKKHGIDTEPGFAPKEVRWAIVCDDDGRFLNVAELGDVEAKRNRGQEFTRCPSLTPSEMVSNKIRSHFLVETTDRVVLYKIKPTDDEIPERHEYFVKLLREASAAMPQLRLIADCLSDRDSLAQIRDALERQRAKPTDKVTFQIGDIFPVRAEAWHDWWRAFRKTLADEEARQPMRGFMTGWLVEPARTHPKIKGLVGVGGRPSGDVLIGFDKPAFTSYGLVQSANAAVCEESAYTYTGSLNYLIKHHSERLAGAMVVHWFKERVAAEDDPLPWLMEGEEQRELNAQEWASKLLTAIRTGKRPHLADNYFYALTLSGASGRVMVRDWMEGQFKELVRNVATWFNDLGIVHREGGPRLAPAPKFLAVVAATARDLADVPAPFVAKMWRVAVRGEAIPQAGLAQALARTRVDILEDTPFNHARMGLMKAYHIRKDRKVGGDTMSDDLKPYLNEDHPDPAYQCGRLMAVLARLQQAALGDVGAGVVQRYYAAASSTPALVLGRLTRTSQFHLNSPNIKGGLAHWYEDKIASIWGRLKNSVPPTLTLEQQSLFALGYYQQMADMRTKKSDDNNNKEEEKQ